MTDVAALVLAAGRGTRMKSTTTHKTMSVVGDKPLLSYTVERLKQAGVNPVIIVVGFAKESITNYFKDSVIYAEQQEPLGTAHAVECGLKKVPEGITDIVSVYGDDSYVYEPALLQKLIKTHQDLSADLTLLTVEKEDPAGMGRIVRNESGNVVEIVEEKVATDEQKKIHEINTGCFIFDRQFITDYINRIEKNPVAGEYYLTDIVAVGRKYNKKIEAVAAGNIPWQGVNRPEELEQARKIIMGI